MISTATFHISYHATSLVFYLAHERTQGKVFLTNTGTKATKTSQKLSKEATIKMAFKIQSGNREMTRFLGFCARRSLHSQRVDFSALKPSKCERASNIRVFDIQ